jgi:DNA-binding FadR family transcriptional regulator
MNDAVRSSDSTDSISGSRISGRIAEELQFAILSGVLAEGTRLPAERVLVQRFGVSRSSVQEAIHRLELQGLVTIRRGSSGGAYVTRPDVNRATTLLQTALLANRLSTAELHTAREALEPGIAAIAARCADADGLASLREGIACDDFHQRLARTTGNAVFEFLMGTLLVACAVPPAGLQRGGEARIRDHERITLAIERRDEAEARTAMTEHLTGRSARGLVDHEPFRSGLPAAGLAHDVAR